MNQDDRKIDIFQFNPLLSILIVNFNGKEHLKECLESVYSENALSFEVLVVDNSSTDGSVDFIKNHFPKTKIISSPTNTGFAGGNNLGIRHCSGYFIFFLNNDTKLKSGAFLRLKQAIESHPDCNVFAALMLQYHYPHLVDSAGDAMFTNAANYGFKGLLASEFQTERNTITACGGAVIFAKSVINKIGGFDEDFFLNLEDVDLSLRAWHAGERILFLPSVVVYHKGSATLGGKRSDASVYYGERNHWWMMIKNWPLFPLFKYFPFWMGLKAAKVPLYILRGQFGIFLKSQWDALGGVRKMMGKRKKIISQSKLSVKEFDKLLNRNWLETRKIKFK